MSMKINTKTPNRKMPKKQKGNKKKLFFIFFGAFMGFFFLCTFVASILTPSIDVPALKNDPGLDSMTSEDFKGRIDPRLKSIELQEDVPPVTGNSTGNPFQKKDGSETVVKDDASIEASNDIGSEFSSTEESFDTVPYNSREAENTQEPSLGPNETMPSNLPTSKPKPQPVIKTPAVSKPEPKPPQNNLMLRDKINVEKSPISMSKVIIGGYSSPIEAKRISTELMGSGLNVTPFIKESNGVYSLQVGSFSNQKKAEVLVNELRSRNMPARIIQD